MKDGGPAFPTTDYDCTYDSIPRPVNYWGMSLRAWYAGKALTGLLSSFDVLELARLSPDPDGLAGALATAACGLADAMIAELDKEDQ